MRELNSIQNLLQEAKTAIAFSQPGLKAFVEEHFVIIEGIFDVMPIQEESRSAGKLDSFQIRLKIPYNFPRIEPRLFATDKGRIPIDPDRHTNKDGSCCFEVWEGWLATQEAPYIEALLCGPVNYYFFGQHYFELHKKWPDSEYAHYGTGLLESFSDKLKCRPKESEVRYHLRLFSKPWPKGHWLCPCGSKKILRRCCTDIYRNPPVPHDKVKLMYRRFKKYYKK